MEKANEKSSIRRFLDRKNITLSPKVYFVEALGAMALGLFASLLIGTIFETLGGYLNIPFLTECASYAKAATGAAIGVAVANSLKAPPLVLLSAVAVGIAGNGMGGEFVQGGVVTTLTAGPAGAFVAVLIATETGKMVSKQTKVDILVTPTVTIFSGVLVAMIFCPGIAWSMNGLGLLIMNATTIQPFLMGIIISVVVGIILTLPISSAAICVMLGLGGISAGAATAGCCAQMVGFAVMSFRENRYGGLVAQGLGTSMLQVGNIVKNPLIWIPTILTSAITGPMATMIFKLENIPIGAGMGTCGLVGPLGVIKAMGANGGANMWIGIALICFILPAVLTLLFSEIMRKYGWIKYGDLKLEL